MNTQVVDKRTIFFVRCRPHICKLKTDTPPLDNFSGFKHVLRILSSLFM